MPRPRRFKVQRRIDIHARDRSNKRFLFSIVWHTLNEFDKQTPADKIAMKYRHDDPKHEFRVAEEWPIGATLRAVR